MSSGSLKFSNSSILVVMQFAASAVIVVTTDLTEATPTVLLVGLLGLGLWGWAVGTMRLSRISLRPEVGDGAALVTHGPFRWVRHPMYSGLALCLLACVLAPFLWWRFLLWVALSVVLFKKSGLEERLLIEKFPGYRDYCRQTKRFVPFLV